MGCPYPQSSLSEREGVVKGFRDWLIQNKLNGVAPAPELPDDIVKKTEKIYKDCYCRITGEDELS